MLDQNSAWHGEFSNFPMFCSVQIFCPKYSMLHGVIVENYSIDQKLFSDHHYCNNNLLGQVIKNSLFILVRSLKAICI